MPYEINHFVTRALLEGWKSQLNSEGQNLVCTYNFKTKNIIHGSDKKIFARRKCFSPAEEKNFNTMIESPMLNFFKRGGKVPKRPLHLAFALQAPRVAKAIAPMKDEDSLFSELLCKPENLLNTISDLLDSRFLLLHSAISDKNKPLYMPIIGFFPFPYIDLAPTPKPSVGYAIPTSPYSAIIRVSRTAKLTNVKSIEFNKWSVGLNLDYTNDDFVAIPPRDLKDLNEEDFVAIPPRDLKDLNEEDLKCNLESIREQNSNFFRDLFSAQSKTTNE